MNKKINILLLGAFMMITGCAPNVSDYKDKTPKLAFEQFFDGDVTAHGIIQDRSGKVLRRFTVAMKGSWNGDKGKLEEYFVYDDGERQERVWNVVKTSENTYEGTASDIVGVAKGEQAGNAIRWAYVMQIPVKGTVYNITFDDWMFLMPDNTMMNRSMLTKFGFKVGEISIFMQKGKHGL